MGIGEIVRRWRRGGAGSGLAAATGASAEVPPAPEVPTVVGPRDPEVARALSLDGYARLGVLLTSDQVERARTTFDEVARRLGRPLGDRWFPTILLPDDDLREFITSELEAIIQPVLDRVIDPEAMSLMRLDYSVKPPGAEGELGPHQDFSLVDERSSTSLYAWIPLEDVDESNGTLHVVPGSHRFCNAVRSQHVPSTFDEVLDRVHRESVRLDCSAGEVVVMVSGVIHHSPVNTSDHVRLAAHGILVPVDVPLVFYYADDATPPDKVECYEFDLDTYVRHIHQGRPDPGVVPDELVDRPPAMTRERFDAGIGSVQRS